MNIRSFPTVKQRRLALEKERGVALPHIGTFTLDEAIASQRNCENMIGVTQVPLGVAGPLVFKHVSGETNEVYIPLATTEGALVASVSRGCKAIAESGGASTHSQKVGATRGPVFKVKNLAENTKLQAFLETHFKDLRSVTETTSHHLTLKSITSQGVGRYCYVRFIYDTQDAMGLNMVSIATESAVGFIQKNTGAHCIALSGNFCVDKKPAWANIINNRGNAAWAEVTLSKDVLSRVLKTDAEAVYETWLAKCMLGSAISGSMGFNAQYANIIAALFIATGQDPAHVVEGSLGVTTTEVVGDGDLYVSVYLPDLMVGTVGGGTTLATQQEALRLLGVAGGNEGKNAAKFAHIVAALCLAGEISLLSSLAAGTLAAAHNKLARGK